MSGDDSGYGGDTSRADAAFLAMLAFWTGPDPERLDRLFRNSGRYREKWERADYRDGVIALALRNRSFYQPRAARRERGARKPRPPTRSPGSSSASTVVSQESRGRGTGEGRYHE
jgi:primase-polymerase (primpol)-like protein